MANPFIPIPTNLAQYLATFGTSTNLNNTTPEAPGGGTNIIWQFDVFGNISGYITGGGGGGNTFGTADYGVTNVDEFTFPNPLIITADAAVGPSTFTDTGGEGGFFVTTDSNSGGIGLVASGLSGITLDSQAGIALSSGGTSQVTISAGSNVAVSSPVAVSQVGAANVPLTVEASNGQSANLVEVQNHTGGFVSGVNKTGDFVLASTSGAPSDAPISNSCRFDPATGTLYIYNGTAWKSTVLL